MRLLLVAPELLALDREALAAAPSLRRLARYGRTPAIETRGLPAALFAAAGWPADTAPAPVAALGAGLAPGTDYVLHADPVSLVAGRDDVMLAGRIDDLTTAQADALVATLNVHFAGDGLTFRAPRPDAWFVTMAVAPAISTTPLARATGALYRHLPGGADAKLWRRWLSEMQMLLHAHAATAQREAEGLPPVTGLWISGGGTLPPPGATPTLRIFAPPGRDGDLARGIARLSGTMAAALPDALDADAQAPDTLVVLRPAGTAAELAGIDRAYLALAVAALERGALRELALVAGGGGRAVTWRATRPTPFARLQARFDARPFHVPAPEGDA